MVTRRVVVRDAKLISPRKTVAYGLLVDGVSWPLFSGAPSFTTSIIETSQTVTVETVPRTWLTGVSVINSIVAAEHTYSGSLDLPSVILAPGASLAMAVSVAIFYQETTAAFDVRVGDMTIELAASSLTDPAFGQQVV